MIVSSHARNKRSVINIVFFFGRLSLYLDCSYIFSLCDIHCHESVDSNHDIYVRSHDLRERKSHYETT